MLGIYNTKQEANNGWNSELKSWCESHKIVGFPAVLPVGDLPISFVTRAMLLPYMAPAPNGILFATGIQTHVLTTTLMLDSQPTPTYPTYSITVVLPSLQLAQVLFSSGNTGTPEDLQRNFFRWLQSIAVTVVDSTTPTTYPCIISEA